MNLEETGKTTLDVKTLKTAGDYVKTDWQVWAYTQKLLDTLKNTKYKSEVNDEKLDLKVARSQKPLFKTIERLFEKREQAILNLYHSTEPDKGMAKNKAELASAYEFISWWPQVREQMIDSIYNTDLLQTIINFDEDYQHYKDILDRLKTDQTTASQNIASK